MNFRFDSLVSTKLLVVVFAATGLWLAGGCVGAQVDEPRSGTKDFNAGWEAVKNREWGEAEDAFSRLMRDHPQSPEGYFGLGVVCAERQEYELAAALFRDTIRLFAMAVYWAYCEDYPEIWNCVRQAEAHGYAVPQDFVEIVRQEEHKAPPRKRTLASPTVFQSRGNARKFFPIIGVVR